MNARHPLSRFALVLALAAALTACDDGDTQDPGTAPDTTADDTSVASDTAEPGDTTDPSDTTASGDSAEPGDTIADADVATDTTDPGDLADTTADTGDLGDASDTSDADADGTNDTTDVADTTDVTDVADTEPPAGIDCMFDGTAYNGYAVDNSAVQLVSDDGAVCVRIERELANDDPFFICKACDYDLLAAWIGHDDATRFQDDPAAMQHYPTHHNWEDDYVVTVDGVRYLLDKATDFVGTGDFKHTLTGFDAADGTTVVFGPVELLPYSP